MAEFVKVAKMAEIAPGQAKMVEVNDKEIALFNVDGSFYAIDNACTHVGGPLSEGELDGPQVTCPLHGSIFNVTTGEVRCVHVLLLSPTFNYFQYVLSSFTV